MRIVRGAFTDPAMLDAFGARTIEKLSRPEWQSIDEVVVDFDQVKDLQRNMTRHYDEVGVPWYMDGHEVDDWNNLLVAFGADDGEGGRIFQFARDNQEAIDEVVNYGVRKGIPKEQMDFVGVDSNLGALSD